VEQIVVIVGLFLATLSLMLAEYGFPPDEH
jgi:hypothetical protein